MSMSLARPIQFIAVGAAFLFIAAIVIGVI